MLTLVFAHAGVSFRGLLVRGGRSPACHLSSPDASTLQDPATSQLNLQALPSL